MIRYLFNIVLLMLLSAISLKNIFCLQLSQQIVTDSNEYSMHLDRTIQEASSYITDIEQEQILEAKIISDLSIDINQFIFTDFSSYQSVIQKRQELLRLLIIRQFAQEENGEFTINENYTVDIQGKKIINLLSNNLIFHEDLWFVLEYIIQEYSKKRDYHMSRSAHYIFNKHIVTINDRYLHANGYRQSNNMYLSSNFFATQHELNTTINLITHYLNDKSQILSKKNSTEFLPEEHIGQNRSDILVQQTEVSEPASMIESTAAEATDAFINFNINISTDVQIKTPKRKPTKKQRDKLKAKKKLCDITKEADSTIQEEESKTEYNLIMADIETESQEVYNIKFIQRINKLDSKQEKENALFALFKLYIKLEIKDLVYKCLDKCPKKPNFLFEYIKFVVNQNIIKENFDKFLEYTKICLFSDFSEEVNNIIENLKARTTDQTLLFEIAGLEIVCKNNIDYFITLFNNAIAENKINDFIQVALETKIYNKLIRWVDNNNIDFLNIYLENLSYMTKTTYFPVSTEIACMEFDTNKDWIKYNIKLLNSLVKKTNSNELRTNLINICIYYGYDILENIVISPDDFAEHIEQLNEEEIYYYQAAQLLLKKNNIHAKKLARIFKNKFKNIQTFNNIIQELEQEQNIKNVTEEIEYWHRLILELNPDELISILVDRIKKEKEQTTNSPDSYKKQILILFKSIILFAKNNIDENAKIATSAIKEYNRNRLQTSQENIKKLEADIYKHPLFTEQCGWATRFKTIQDAYSESNISIDLTNYLKSDIISDTDIIYFNTKIFYKNISLTPDQIEHTKNASGDTVLHLAVYYHLIDIVEFIINKHPELLKVKNNSQETAIFKAFNSPVISETYQDNIIKIAQILNSIDPNIIYEGNKDGFTPLKLAICKDYLDVFKYIINECISSNQRYNSSTTNCLSYIEVLLTSIPDPEIKGDNHSPLSIITQSSRTKFLDYLLKNNLLNKKLIHTGIRGSLDLNLSEQFIMFFNALDQTEKEAIAEDSISRATIWGDLVSIKHIYENNYLRTPNMIQFVTELIENAQENRMELIVTATDQSLEDYDRQSMKAMINNLKETVVYWKSKLSDLKNPKK